MPKKSGPPKGKRQLTIRFDEKLLQQFEAQQKAMNLSWRITDALEEGLVLWLQQHDLDLSVWDLQLRFVLANVNREQHRKLRRVLVYLVVDQIRKPTDVDRILGRPFGEYLESLEPYFPEAVRIFVAQAERKALAREPRKEPPAPENPPQARERSRFPRNGRRRKRGPAAAVRAKEEALVTLLRDGATVAEMAEASGLAKATVNIWLSRLRKRYVIERTGKDYRILEERSSEAGIT